MLAMESTGPNWLAKACSRACRRYAPSGLLMAAILAISYLRLPYGCDLVDGPGDEGFYLSSA